jgi:hypothetical protein
MAEKKGDGDGKPRPVTIPRPPSKEDVDRVSGQQGMITDEWAGDPTPTDAPKPEDRPEEEAKRQPG